MQRRDTHIDKVDEQVEDVMLVGVSEVLNEVRAVERAKGREALVTLIDCECTFRARLSSRGNQSRTICPAVLGRGNALQEEPARRLEDHVTLQGSESLELRAEESCSLDTAE